MNEKEISESLFRWLEPYSVIKWHKNRNHSFYLKFRDVRLGSIRVSNHPGRELYRYTYKLYRQDEEIEKKISDVVSKVIAKSETIKNFDPKKFIVWDKENKVYKEVADYKTYRATILKQA